jgi:regulation of enolase protein 1 (concanavalin A-like superfamily)
MGEQATIMVRQRAHSSLSSSCRHVHDVRETSSPSYLTAKVFVTTIVVTTRTSWCISSRAPALQVQYQSDAAAPTTSPSSVLTRTRPNNFGLVVCVPECSNYLTLSPKMR